MHEPILILFKGNLQSLYGWYEVNGRLSKSIEFLALFQKLYFIIANAFLLE